MPDSDCICTVGLKGCPASYKLLSMIFRYLVCDVVKHANDPSALIAVPTRAVAQLELLVEHPERTFTDEEQQAMLERLL